MRPRNDVRKLFNYNRLPENWRSCECERYHFAERRRRISGTTYPTGTTNGDGIADFMIKVDGSHVFAGGDFGL